MDTLLILLILVAIGVVYMVVRKKGGPSQNPGPNATPVGPKTDPRNPQP